MHQDGSGPENLKRQDQAAGVTGIAWQGEREQTDYLVYFQWLTKESKLRHISAKLKGRGS